MFFSQKPIIVFDGDVCVRSAGKGDAALAGHYFNKNRTFLKPWDPTRDESFYCELGWKSKLARLEELHRSKQGLYLLILNAEQTQVLGIITFSQIQGFPMHSCNLGYSLDQSMQGQGLMTRCLKYACQFMFDHYHIHRIQAAYMPHNQRSAQVLARLGFSKEGEASDYLLIDGQWQDHILTSLTNPDWTPINEQT